MIKTGSINRVYWGKAKIKILLTSNNIVSLLVLSGGLSANWEWVLGNCSLLLLGLKRRRRCLGLSPCQAESNKDSCDAAQKGQLLSRVVDESLAMVKPLATELI